MFRYPIAFVVAGLLLVIGLVAVPSQAAMKMTPYLQAVTTTSIYVMVECDSTTPPTVQYGLDTSYGSTATGTSYKATSGSSPQTYMHRVQLTGLTPNTQYHYRASHDGVTWSSDYTFWTAVEPGTPFRFAAIADARTNTTPHNTIAGRIRAANPRFTLFGGDTCNDSGYSTFKNEWFLSNELLLQAGAPTYNAPGNHEGWSTNTQAFFQSPASASGKQDYYSFDYGDVHVASINNQVSYSVSTTAGTQYKYFYDDLAASTKPWKVVFFHEPAYCSGGHGENATMVQWSNNIFVPSNVDLVLTGHTHFYQHNLVKGINHLVIGSCGAPLYTPTTGSYTIKSAQVYHYGIIDVTPTTLHMDVYTDAGTLLDTLDLFKTVAAAKKKPNGTICDVMGTSVVTHVPAEAGVFYVQDSAGTAGIRCETTAARPAEGAKVLVRGTLATKANGERALTGVIVTNKGGDTSPVRGMNHAAVGGIGYVGSESIGLSNQGLLVKVWGQVTKTYNDPVLGPVFWIDDGSGVDSGEPDGTLGLKIIESGITPNVGDSVKVAGIVASDNVTTKQIRVIRCHEIIP